MIRRALILAVCFTPIVLVALVGATMGDCSMDVPVSVCSSSKDQAVRTYMGVVLATYLLTLLIRTLYRQRRPLD
jgi:hypothetical protein